MNNLFEYAVEEDRAATLQQNIEKLLVEEKFNELQKVLETELVKYNRVYTVETVKEAKADRASLNKLSKAIADVRKARRKEVLKQVEEFEAGCKDLEKLVDNASSKIDEQVKAVEEARREARKQAIIEYYGTREDVIPLEKIIDNTWLNASVTDSNWKKALDTKYDHIQGELKVIESFGDEKARFVRLEYLGSLDLFKALKAYEAFAAMQEAIKPKVEEIPEAKENPPVQEEQPHTEGDLQAAEVKLYDVSYTFIASDMQLISINAHMEALGIHPIVMKEEI